LSLTEYWTEPPLEPVAVKPETVWWVIPPVLSSAHPICARFHSSPASSVAVSDGSDGSAPRQIPASASTSFSSQSTTRHPR
jgi:hypothetical protein